MAQQIAALLGDTSTVSISLEHAIIHHLDPEGNAERLVAAEIDFVGQKGDFARHRLEAFLQRSYEQSHTGAVAAREIDMVGDDTTLGVSWRTLDNTDGFVSASVKLARLLSAAMRTRRNISEGDLFIAIANDDLGPMMCILKLQKWEELVREWVPHPDGTYTVEVVPNDNIIHTRTVPQKCAFIRPPNHPYGAYVRLNDTQVREREHAARFFVEQFLGCRLITTPVRRTIDFCVAAESWRQEHRLYLPLQGIASFANALDSLLTGSELSFQKFAETALTGANYNPIMLTSLVTTLAKSVYQPEGQHQLHDDAEDTFVPDQETADKMLETIDLTLSGGIRVTGPRASMLRVLAELSPDKEEGNRKLSLSLLTTTMTRKFPGSSVVKFQEPEDE